MPEGRSAALRQGQAVVELVVGLICLLVVIGGLLQLVLMARSDTETLQKATAEAASRAADSGMLSESFSPIRDWEPGADTYLQTKDDVETAGSFGPLRDRIARKTFPDGDMSAVDGARFGDMQELATGGSTAALHGMVSGEASEEVEVLPVSRALFGLKNPATVENTVWFPKITRLMDD